jgi:exopolysaccharide biosynthesis WecB/TagA/CpsF family protein
MNRLVFRDLTLISDVFDRVADWMIDRAQRPLEAPTIVAHVNVHNLYQFERSPALVSSLERHAELLLEGIGMKAGCLLSGNGWPADLNGTDLFPMVMQRAVRHNVPIYLLGGTDPVVRAAAVRVRAAFPGVHLAGFRSGYFEPSCESQIVRDINRTSAGIVLVGRGCPLQEEFAIRQRTSFTVPVLWMVGGLLDFVSLRRPRAPRVLRDLRLEWLFRWGLEPRRKSHRNLIAVSWFLKQVLWDRRPTRYQRWSQPDTLASAAAP